MKNNHYKFLAVVGFVALLLVIAGFKPQRFFTASGADTDAASVYKTKCSVCHTAKAEKFFDLSKSDEQHAAAILKGKKDAKPPMPEFASKGVTPELAKALVAHMRSLRSPGAANANANANTGGNTNVAPNANANLPVNTNANRPGNANNANKPLNANANKPLNTNARANKPVNMNAKPND